MQPDRFKKVFFLGIGGIGMSALARYFHASGWLVAGYDRTPTSLTAELQQEGISVHFDDKSSLIPAPFTDPEQTMVVLTPAIPANCAGLDYFRSLGFTIFKRAEVLGMLTQGKRALCIAGTHGKTTVSSMVASVFHHSDAGCNAFLGGISKNFNSNVVLAPNSQYVVAEADEFDRSFLQLHPSVAVITAIDADHLDIYGSPAQVYSSFRQFAAQVKPGGKLIVKKGIDIGNLPASIEKFSYHLFEKTDFYATNIALTNERYYFDLVVPDGDIKGLSLGHPGLVNVENAVAAAAVAWLEGIDRQVIREAISLFSGVKRRFDIVTRTEDVLYIDDYAHHPRELDAFIGSVRKLFPKRKVTGIFQPHLYSRTRDFAGEFAVSLSKLDELVLLDIYPAREMPIQGVTAGIIFDQVSLSNKHLIKKEDVVRFICNRKLDILLTMGAGDIDQLVGPISELLTINSHAQ